MHLSATEARVLGALIEKEVTTPEYYPLSLNALTNACNQKNNREPIMALGEEEVRQALHGLEDDRLASAVRGDSRVPKYEHHLGEVFNFTRAETALICTLLLRGPQTPGELRGRTERMYRFDELSDVLSVLEKLSTREPALVKLLPRQPGTKEARYTHLLSGEPQNYESATYEPTTPATRSASPANEPPAVDEAFAARVSELEAQVTSLTQELNQMRQITDRLAKLLD